MTTDPGDLVLDPTCGSGTTAYVAERWERRWISIDTSRVALAIARARLMGARYPYYLLADSREGQQKEAEITDKPLSEKETHGDLKQGFVYERVPHVSLKSIADNTEIDTIWENYQKTLEPLRLRLNAAVDVSWEEWEIPRAVGDNWSPEAKQAHDEWWRHRRARQKKIDDSIDRNADVEFLYDKPCEDKSKVRVTGPFTVESLSPHRMVTSDESDSTYTQFAPLNDFTDMVLSHLKSAGVHQTKRDDRLSFSSVEAWPGEYIAAVGRFTDGEREKRAAIFIGPEFGTVTLHDVKWAAVEAIEARFDMLIACGFNFDAQAYESKLGALPILKVKMNPELHMAGELKNTGNGNLFVSFGEPDIDLRESDGLIVVEVLGVDKFNFKTYELGDEGTDDIAAWFIDTNYNRESFFVRHAYFLGTNDPYKSLKSALKAEIDREAWETLYRDTSTPFAPPASGRFAVKVINYFGDEFMKVFKVGSKSAG